MPRKKERLDDPLESHDLHCRDSSCLFCIMKEPNLEKRRFNLAKFFKDLPAEGSTGQAFAVAGLWTLAASSAPDNADLVELGLFECMSALLWKGIRDRRWLLQGQNISVPYYVAHIVGSYTMDREDLSERAVKDGVISPLVELLRGRLTWVEQRVAVRALGHIASWKSTFLCVAAQGEVLELAMELAVCSLEIVYTHFIQFEEKRLRYHRDLLMRGVAHGGAQAEARKAEEWASQLQCWSLQFINCFAFKEKFVPTICRRSFLSKLPNMWGGLANEDSPAGIGLLRTICQHKLGRTSVAACSSVVEALCRIARSSDDWQYMAVECLLLLLQDTRTRQRVMDMAAVALVDLAELPSLVGSRRRKLGSEIVDTLLRDDSQSPSTFLRSSLSARSRRLLDELANQRHRMRWERCLSKQECLAREQSVLDLKLEGNARFSVEDIPAALSKYTQALSLCPLRSKKERIVLYSNRAQCHLLLQDPGAAISDTTRALSLFRPVNCHGKSLWRRAQAYEIMGLAKESLLDAIMFINECTHLAERSTTLLNQNHDVPDYAEQLVRKQMQAAWLFKEATLKHGGPSPTSEAAIPVIAASSSAALSTAALRPTALHVENEVDEEGSVSDSNSELIASNTSHGSMTIDQETEEGALMDENLRLQRQKLIAQSRSVLHSLQDFHCKRPSNQVDPLQPTVIRRESLRNQRFNNRHEYIPGHLDTGLLKKSIYDLIQQKFFLDKDI